MWPYFICPITYHWKLPKEIIEHLKHITKNSLSRKKDYDHDVQQMHQVHIVCSMNLYLDWIFVWMAIWEGSSKYLCDLRISFIIALLSIKRQQ